MICPNCQKEAPWVENKEKYQRLANLPMAQKDNYNAEEHASMYPGF